MIAGDAVESRMEVVAALAHGASHAAGIARLVAIEEVEPAVAGQVQGQGKGGNQARLDERRPGWRPSPSVYRRSTIRPGLGFVPSTRFPLRFGRSGLRARPARQYH